MVSHYDYNDLYFIGNKFKLWNNSEVVIYIKKKNIINIDIKKLLIINLWIL